MPGDSMEFKPKNKNLTKVLGDLEADLMETLWSLEAGNVKEIHSEVQKKRKVAVTTVATVLDRLNEKGFVERELKKGTGVYYEYKPTATKKQFERNVVESVLGGLFETFGESTVSYLADEAGIVDEAALGKLRLHLERLKSERNEE